jgi:hypothetical protein
MNHTCTGLSVEQPSNNVRGTGTPKDKDEVNRREVSECDG